MDDAAVCCIPVSPLRAEPSHRSEMISQLLFGERCVLLQETDSHWLKLRCLNDGYEGWCQDSHIMRMKEEGNMAGGSLVRDWSARIELDGQPMMVPMGSDLTGMHRGRLQWDHVLIDYTGELWIPGLHSGETGIIRQLSSGFLNTAYLWGGKSVFGADCSGFTQTIYKFLDFQLRRDAWQQAEQGEPVAALSGSRCGDLAFFDSGEDRITHVGILLGDYEIIHASGIVRVDRIGEMGIIHNRSGKVTHRLRCIRRMFP